MNDEYDKRDKPPVEDWAMSEPNVQPEQPAPGADNFDITLVGVNAPTAAAITEDWAMNTPNTNSDDKNKPDTWELPPPVFRISSGKKLDKEHRKTPPMSDSTPADLPPVEVQTSETAAPPNPDIQPQPFISEEFSVNEVAAKTPAKAKSGSLKLILLIIGLAIMALLAAGFLAGVYYWFFSTPDA